MIQLSCVHDMELQCVFSNVKFQINVSVYVYVDVYASVCFFLYTLPLITLRKKGRKVISLH